MVQTVTGKASARDGCQLFHRLYPQPGKPRLALIHSLALSTAIWDGVVKHLAPDAEILVYDCRGHGESERRPGDYTAELFAEDLADLMNHFGWPGSFIAGCSMGGCAAQAFAAAHSERVHGLALIDTTAWYGERAADDWRLRAAAAAEKGFAAMLPFQLSRWFSDRFRAAHATRVEALSRVFLANDLGCYQSACGLLGGLDLRGALASLRAPVSVIVGEEDYATPRAMAQAIHESFPGSTLITIPGRHLTPVENPREIVTLLRKLFARGERK